MSNLAYVNAPGALPKILNKICEAAVPESFNSDFLGTKLGFPGSSNRTFISWAKKCELLNTDGTPTQIYKNFRNPSYRGIAMAEALKKGYSELYIRNEYAHELTRKDLIQLVSEITGSPHDNTSVKNIVASFWNTKEFANFDAKHQVKEQSVKKEETKENSNDSDQTSKQENQNGKVNLGLNYTINLVLPKTDDPAIFDAIFKSLKENLLNE